MRTLTDDVGVTLAGFIAAPDGSTDVVPVDRSVLDHITSELPETLPTHVRAQLGVTASGTRLETVVTGGATCAPALDVGIASP